MKIGDLNPWPAFSDVLFMLFITTLIGAGVITHWAVSSEERLEEQLKGCGAAKQFMRGLSSCLEAPFDESDAACKVSLGEERLLFRSGQSTLDLASESFAEQLGACLADGLMFAHEDKVLFDSIEFVAIDGYTDCYGEEMENLLLGARRAYTIYGFFIEEVNSRGLPPTLRAELLQKVSIRSYGRNRPRPESPCAKDPEGSRYRAFAADRRVELSINSRLFDQ